MKIKRRKTVLVEMEHDDCKAAFESISLVEVQKIKGWEGLKSSQIADAAIANLKRLSPDLRDQLLLLGAIAASDAYAEESAERRRPRIDRVKHARRLESNERRKQSLKLVMGARSEKVRAFDRIVEMLDHHKVNGKALGDCRRGDLLRAATENLSRADDLTVHAALYKQLAGMIGDGTVREYRDRAGVVALLTTTFEGASV